MEFRIGKAAAKYVLALVENVAVVFTYPLNPTWARERMSASFAGS
jgi:hypothetical protein